MKFVAKNLIITGVVASATLLSLVTVNAKPVTAQGADNFSNAPISTEYNNNCDDHNSEGHEGHQTSSSTPKQ